MRRSPCPRGAQGGGGSKQGRCCSDTAQCGNQNMFKKGGPRGQEKMVVFPVIGDWVLV